MALTRTVVATAAVTVAAVEAATPTTVDVAARVVVSSTTTLATEGAAGAPTKVAKTAGKTGLNKCYISFY